MATTTQPRKYTPARRNDKPKKQPPYNVVLIDDNDHTYEYVIEMLQRLFGKPREDAYLNAVEVDRIGRAIIDTTTKERAELKRDQIHAYGQDWRIIDCEGSMTAIIEPVP